MITCSRCKSQLEDGSIFCDYCGARIASSGAPLPPVARGNLTCIKCGQPVVAGEAFCEKCGASLSPAASQPAPPEEHPPSPKTATKKGAQPAAPNAPRLVVQPENVSIPFPPGKTEVIAGREDPGSNIFPELNLGPYNTEKGAISRRHAKFSLRDDRWQIEDLNSTNFTFLNKQKLQPGQLYPLNDGDEIRLGQVTMTFLTT